MTDQTLAADYSSLVAGQRAYFKAGHTRPVEWRIEQLTAIKAMIDSVEAVIDWVSERPRPLGLYVFTEDEDVAERILKATNSGDACVNDCSVHPLVPELPFGGVGNSGMGKYHGRWGFESAAPERGSADDLQADGSSAGVKSADADTTGRPAQWLGSRRPNSSADPRHCSYGDGLPLELR